MNLFVENNFVKQQNICLIPGSGVDYERFAPMPKTLAYDAFVFLFIGRLLKDKGITELVTASRILKQQGIKFTCLVVGSLWTQNLKKNTITQNDLDEWIQEELIKYEGHSTDVRQQIANADCFVLPSYREGTSNVLLEASSMEKPCITCDTTGCREIVEDKITGLLCKVADAEDLAEKMKQMISFSYEKRHQTLCAGGLRRAWPVHVRSTHCQ
jgi:glycosyltransferase involved in cell wall biosynthesis